MVSRCYTAVQGVFLFGVSNYTAVSPSLPLVLAFVWSTLLVMFLSLGEVGIAVHFSPSMVKYWVIVI